MFQSIPFSNSILSSRAITALLLITLGVFQAFATPLANEKMVFIEKTGTDSSGNTMYRIVSGNNTQMRALYDRFYRDTGVQKAIEAHQRVESEQLAISTPPGQHSIAKPNPIFVELGQGTGTYNDWKGSFSVQDVNGRVYSYDEPRVLVDLNDSMFRASDQSLVEQTIVHEIGHGIMRKAYGKDALPDTSWLGRPHYGDLVTDDQLALIEGWAEFLGAFWTGRNTIAEDPPESLMMNAYAYQDNGQPKTPEQLFATEGWVATVMLHIANHPGIPQAFEKMIRVMREGKVQNFNELLREYIKRNPEDAKHISEVLTKDSLQQFSAPLGGEIVSKPGDTLPPPVDQPSGQGNEDQDLTNLFNDYQSSLETYAQLRLDMVHPDWYAGAQFQEIQRRLSFQYSLVKNLESQLMGQLQAKAGVANQELIAMALLDNLDKLRYEHNRALQSYQKTNWWNHQVRNNLKAELDTYQELYQMNKAMADKVDLDTIYRVWNQRNARMQYRVEQKEYQAVTTGVASPGSSSCTNLLDPRCREAYNKLVGAIETNQNDAKTRNYLLEYNEKRNQQ